MTMFKSTWIQKEGKVFILPNVEYKTKELSYLEDNNVIKIPESDLPLLVLSSNATNAFAFGIINLRKSIYNHFMWMHKPGLFATQDWSYKEAPISDYLGFNHRLKLWHNPSWTPNQKSSIINQIQFWLDKPKYKTMYDILAIFGQALNKIWIQNPFLRICSDYGSILRESGVDLNYNLKNPAPDQVDKWLNSNSDYAVYGRYAGE